MNYVRLAAGCTLVLGLVVVGPALLSARPQPGLQQQMNELQQLTEKMLAAPSPCPFLPDYRKIIARIAALDPEVGAPLMSMLDAVGSSCPANAPTSNGRSNDSGRVDPGTETVRAPRPVRQIGIGKLQTLGPNGGCVTVTPVETTPLPDGRVETTLELRNGCGKPQLVEAMIAAPTGGSFGPSFRRPFWFGTGMNSPDRAPGMSWPPNNPLPKLGYDSLDDATHTTFTFDKGGTARATEIVEPDAPNFDVKIAACDFYTGDGTTLLVTAFAATSPSVNTAFRNIEFTRFDCVKVPPNDPSANAKEWERIKNGSLDKPAPRAAPAPKPKP